MVKQVFIINGSGGVGKDAFISFIADNYSTMNFSSIDKVKEMARIAGWDGGKTENDRKFLSDLKLLCICYNNMPLNSMKDKYQEFLNSDSTFLFLHIREPEEIKKAKPIFDAKTILIKRDDVKCITSNMSDEKVFNYKYDFIIDNNGTLNDLMNKAWHFSNDFIKGNASKEY